MVKSLSRRAYVSKVKKFHAFAPGRVELLGNHTDYNQGVVLSAALDLGVSVQGVRRNDERIILCSEGHHDATRFGEPAFFKAGNNWADYPLGVVKTLSESGYRIGGFEASFVSTLPSGAGLSSSAAIEVATAILLQRMFDLDLEQLDAARICRHAENQFVGVNCGLLDQASSAMGRRDHALLLDCRAETVCHLPLSESAGLLVVHSGVKHALVGGEYNERRSACFEAAARMGVPALRDVSTADVEAADLSEEIRRRARHITGENERVFQGAELLRKGELQAFGQLMFDSHESSRLNFENSTPELDALVGIAKDTPGIMGARLTGGGFGGAIVALVEKSQTDAASKAMAARYRELTSHTAHAFACAIGDGAFFRN